MFCGHRAWKATRLRAKPQRHTLALALSPNGTWINPEQEKHALNFPGEVNSLLYSFAQAGEKVLSSEQQRALGGDEGNDSFSTLAPLPEEYGSDCDQDESGASEDLEAWFPDLSLGPGGDEFLWSYDESWQFKFEEACIVLCREDNRELHWVIPFIDDWQFHSSLRKFTFVGFRRCHFSNGKERTISWCSGAGCTACSRITATLYSGVDFIECEIDDEAVLPREGGTCPIAAKLMSEKGGEKGLHSLMAISLPSRTAVFEKSFTCQGIQYIAVNPSVPVFERWGVVKLFDRMSSQSLVCQTCSSKPCVHQKVLSTHVGHSSAQLSKLDFERLFAKKFDSQSGTLKLRCISKLPLPLPGKSLESWNDGELYKLIRGQCEGSRVPSQLYPAGFSKPCVQCHAYNWTTETPATPCMVWGRVAVYEVQVYSCVCDVCGDELVVDGPEYGLLRQDRKNIFELDMLYNWIGLLSTDKAPKWFTYWRDTTLGYNLPAGSSEEERAILWRAGREAFVQATFDFVALMPEMKTHMITAFQCQCRDRDELSVDGLVVGNHKADCYVTHPWANGRECTDPPVAGSLYTDRVFLANAELQKFVLRHVQAVSPPLTPYEHQAMITALTQDCPSLVPFIDSDNVEYLGPCKILIKNLAYASPVSKLAPPQTWRILENLISGYNITSDLISKQLHPHTPILAEFLAAPFGKSLLGKACPASVVSLLIAVLEKAKLAYKPASNIKVQNLQDKSLVASDENSPHSLEDNNEDPTCPPPSAWSSWDEFFFRTGVWGGWDVAPNISTGEISYQASDFGGAHVHRKMRNYAADMKSFGTSRSAHTCTKNKPPASKLIPGFVFFWCLHCGKCKRFALMPQAESPKLVFQLLYCLWRTPPSVIGYDNNCTVESYILNREPKHFKWTKFLIDWFHFAGHTHCSDNYNSKLYEFITNASMSEQKNVFLSCLKENAPFMNQFTLLWYLRLFLFMRNMNISPRFWQLRAGKRLRTE